MDLVKERFGNSMLPVCFKKLKSKMNQKCFNKKTGLRKNLDVC